MRPKEKLVLFGSLVALFLSLINESTEIDVNAQQENYEPDYKDYHNLKGLETEVHALAETHTDIIKLNSYYKSRNGRSQLVFRISNFSSHAESAKDEKVRILLSFGEHAREFFPVESMLNFINNITLGLSDAVNDTNSGLFSSWVLNNFDIIIIGIANPDGREFIEGTKNYCWRGTLSGVDINRNFNWNFGGEGSSSDPKDEEFRGPRAFSEPETEVFRNISSIFSPDAYISFHSGIRHVYIPFSDSESKRQRRHPSNTPLLIRLARHISRSSPPRPFKFGFVYDLTGYTADGTSFDFMAGKAKVPFSLAIELWQHDNHRGPSCFDEFNPRSEDLQTELDLIHPLYIELLNYLYNWKLERPPHKKKKKGIDVPLVRKRKDDGHQRLPSRKNFMFYSEEKNGSFFDLGGSLSSQIVFLVVFVVTVTLVSLLVRHICNTVRKKRIISLRSLSATFTLLKLY